MKRVLRSLTVLIFLTLLTTGCVKMNTTMTINKDKSMILEIIAAVDKSLIQNSSSSIFNEESMEEYKKQGFESEKYDDGSKVGYKLTKKIKNIDDISSNADVKSNISVMSEGKKSGFDKMFKLKKGLIKNKYKAQLTSSDADNMSSNAQEDLTSDSNENNTVESGGDFPNLTQTLTSGMDLKVVVNLPYKALKNNATDVSNAGKTLTWDLVKLGDKDVEFEFELYNFTNIIIIAGVIILAVMIIILINKRKHKVVKTENIEIKEEE